MNKMSGESSAWFVVAVITVAHAVIAVIVDYCCMLLYGLLE